MLSLVTDLRAREELELYFEALEVWKKMNEFDLCSPATRLFKAMPETTRSTTRRLSIRSVEL
jgi:hypothetical protein